MQVAFVLYPRFTALDLIGPHEVLNSLPDVEPVFVAESPGPVENESGTLSVVATHAFEQVPSPEIVVVPGGLAHRDLDGEAMLAWLRSVHETSRWTTSVCTGSIILAKAGLLEGVPATTHWLERDLLAELGAKPVPDRVVRHGKIFTAAGVSSGIDMALTLVKEMYGEEAAQAVQLGIEYDPEPPVDAGSPEKAPEAIREAVSAVMSAQMTAGAG